jgi:hypothetical protein
MFTHGELGNKEIYGAMQGLEVSYRNKNNHHQPIFLRKNILLSGKRKLDLLGMPSDDENFPYFWVVTNAHVDNDITVPEKVYEMGQGNFYLTCSHLDGLNKKENIDKVVYNYLKKQCQ